MTEAELIEALSAEFDEASGLPVLALSAAAKQGLTEVLDQLAGRLDPEEQPEEATEENGRAWSPL